MASRFQAASLVASPSCPNAIVWSDENLVAVASGHIVTILNPAMPFGPRGLITIPSCKPFPIGVIKREDLLTGGLLPTCLSRDLRPCVRSISWSPIGFAPNAGCLLAICTTEGRVKLYRSPFCEFSSEWVEVMDISEMLHTYFASISFGELDVPSSEIYDGQVSQLGRQYGCNDDQPIVSMPNSKAKKSKKVVEKCSLPFISAGQYASRSAVLSSHVVAWSPILQVMPEVGLFPTNNSSNGCSLLAVGAKTGRISFWRIHEPQCYSILQSRYPTAALFIGLLQAHDAWITAISWALFVSDASNPQLLLATGSSDGSVKLWRGDSGEMLKSSEDSHTSFSLLKESRYFHFMVLYIPHIRLS